MTAGVQCETCRAFSPQPCGQWLYLVRPAADPVMATLGLGPRDDLATFCSLRCLVEWGYVKLAAGEPATGTEPPPASGIGWPG